MRNKKTLSITAILFAAVLLAAFVIFHGSKQAMAQTGTTSPPEPDSISDSSQNILEGEEFQAFGVAGFTRGQIVRLHAVALGVPHTQRVVFEILDSRGNLLAGASPLLSPSGRAFTLDLPFGERDGNRLEIYAVIRFPNGKPRTGYVISTLEIVDDRTGKTRVLAANPEG